jgi:crossover junction endodeoxyribonuclease RuvC
VRILGIDPGSLATGFGVIEASEGRLRHVVHGTLRLSRSASLGERLAALHADLVDVIETQRPDVAAVERVFVAASARAALVLGHARGVALAAVSSARVPVSEYSASEVKQAAVGNGRAEKRQVQAMVRVLLGLEHVPGPDAADALAVAICHAHSGRLGGLASRGRRSRGARQAQVLWRRVR